MDKLLINKISNYFINQPIEKAWLFGSFARSEDTNESDIDILVNFAPNTKVTLFKYIHIVNDLQTITGRKVDLIENGQLKAFALISAENEKVLIYERKAKR